MAELELREAFNDCIDRMAAGQSIADCLRMYPQYAVMLRPMLEVGSMVERTQATSFEVAAAQARVRTRVNQRLNSPPPAQRSYGRLVVLAASLLIAFVAIFGAAENSLPGDTLYSVKRLSENARGTILGEQFGGRRLDEIRVLLALKREVDVDFTGKVQQIDNIHWRVEGLDLQVGAGTQGAASVSVGDSVRVTAHTSAQGELVALTITLLEKAAPPSPTPTLLPSESLTSTTTPTPTPTSTDTPTLTPTLQPTQLETIAVSTAAVCVPTMPSGWVRYIIQAGDLVTVLAQQTGASVAQLIVVNCLPETQMIIVGQILFLPMLPPETAVPTQQPTSAPGQQSGAQPTDDSGHDGGDHHGGGSGDDGGGSGNSGSGGGGNSGGPG